MEHGTPPREPARGHPTASLAGRPPCERFLPRTCGSFTLEDDARTRTLTSHGLRFPNRSYLADWMTGQAGRKVTVRFMPTTPTRSKSATPTATTSAPPTSPTRPPTNNSPLCATPATHAPDACAPTQRPPNDSATNASPPPPPPHPLCA
ncbi:Mu transposase C-terminal domain-containing protein [Streptomyces sp. NPDC056255]|uniref:Mu transposase C-terminal domain-containing protein n=1 Tax=Streptomyces sp. NPDC056255 TaxID=3345764 RepID=UPI0035DDE060